VLEPVSYGLDFTISLMETGRELRAAAEARLADVARALSDHDLLAQTVLRAGLPADAVLDYAAHETTDLIVMGTHGRRGLSHALFGSVAEAVLRRADRPVISVKSPKFAPGHQHIVGR
jgi:nucleotide-binding universal stress UspA family protein